MLNIAITFVVRYILCYISLTVILLYLRGLTRAGTHNKSTVPVPLPVDESTSIYHTKFDKEMLEFGLDVLTTRAVSSGQRLM